MNWLTETDAGVELHVRIIPNASRNQIVGEHDGRLKIKLMQPAVDGAANTGLILFLSSTFTVPKSRIRITRGTTGREKTVQLISATRSQIYSAI